MNKEQSSLRFVYARNEVVDKSGALQKHITACVALIPHFSRDDHSLIGIGSTILNHATIGAHSIVGTNALITENKSFPEDFRI